MDHPTTELIGDFLKDHIRQKFIEQVMDSQGILHKICRIYCDAEEERKDLSQEILIHLWRSYGSFRAESKFSTWMYRVALNVALQHIRSVKKRSVNVKLTQDLQQLADTPSNMEAHEENSQLLQRAIRHLNDIEKAIVMLYLEEKTNEEIARIVGITQNHARVKMNRIKTKLKKIMIPESHGT